MKLLRPALILSLVLAASACGTKSALVTPQCSKEERAENADTAASVEDATNVPSASSTPSKPTRCGKLTKGQRDPSQPPNPISR